MPGRSSPPFGLRQIEVFRALMVCGSVTGAAELLFISVPAVSRMLAHMEMRLGFLLFERVRGRLTPTHEAKRLFPEISQLFDGVARCNELADRLRVGGEGTLRIAASPNLGMWLTPMAARRFHEVAGDVKLHIGTHTPEQLISELLLGTTDLGVSLGPVDHPALTNVPVGASRMVFACPSSHRFANRVSVGLAELRDEPVIGFPEKSPYGALLAMLRGGPGGAADGQLEVRFPHLACALVNAGAGVALIDALSVHAGVWPGVVAVPVEPLLSIQVCAVQVAMEAPSRHARRFVDSLRAVMQAEHAQAV